MTGKLICLDQTGHTEVAYDTDTAEGTADAAQRFLDHVARGGAAFGATAPGAPAVRLAQFSPEYQEITLVPRLVGG